MSDSSNDSLSSMVSKLERHKDVERAWELFSRASAALRFARDFPDRVAPEFHEAMAQQTLLASHLLLDRLKQG